MRFEELSLRIPGDELRMRFHEKTTVLSGIGALERQGLVESLLGALAAGPAQQAELTYIDAQGRRVRIRRDPTGDVTHTFDDGAVAPDFLAVLGVDLNGLRDLAHVRAGDLGLLTTDIGLPEPPELTESRAALAELNERLESALAARHAVEAMRMELSRIDEGMREADEGRAKRRYARLLTDLERVRAEATAMRTGDAGAASDKRFVEAARLALRVAERWHRTRDTLKQVTADFGDRERLDARTLAEAESMPEHAPAGLDALVAKLEQAESRRNSLAARLSTLAASRLPEPSHPSVVRLARGDQETVWGAAQKTIDSSLRLESESINLGGLAAEGLPNSRRELEVAHEGLEAAQSNIREAESAPAICATGGAMRAIAGNCAHPVPPRGTPRHRRRRRRGRVVDPAAPPPAGRGEGTGGEALTQAETTPTCRSTCAASTPPSTRPAQAPRPGRHPSLRRPRSDNGTSWPVRSVLSALSEIRTKDPKKRTGRDAPSVAPCGGIRHDPAQVKLASRGSAAHRAFAQLKYARCRPFGVDDPRVAAAMVRHQIEIAPAPPGCSCDSRLRRTTSGICATSALRPQAAGLRRGDVITRVGGVETRSRRRSGAKQAPNRGATRTSWGGSSPTIDDSEKPNTTVARRSTPVEPDMEELAWRRGEHGPGPRDGGQAHLDGSTCCPNAGYCGRASGGRARVLARRGVLGQPALWTPDIEAVAPRPR